MGEGGGGEHELPLYVRADIDDEGEDVSTPAQDTAALVLGVSAGGFALVGDVLIPTHAGQAFVWMALTVVVVSVAVVANRSRGDPRAAVAPPTVPARHGAGQGHGADAGRG